MIAQESCNQTKKANFKATKSVPIIMDLNTVTQDALKVITKVQGPNMITLNSITRIPIDLKVAKSKTTIKLITAFRERTEVVTNMVEMVRAERHVVGLQCLLFTCFLDCLQLIVLQVYYLNVSHLTAIQIIFTMAEVAARQ